jgi:hypothetical protein
MIEAKKPGIALPDAPKLGPPASYFHVIWIDAPEGEAVEWFDELDAERWSIRCVRKFQDGSWEGYSYASPAWREKMPDQPAPSREEINQNPEFLAKEIGRTEFEAVWQQATANLA